MMNSIRVYYINHNGKRDLAKVDKERVAQWLSELSSVKCKAVNRFIHTEDKIASLLALQLLKKCTRDAAIDGFNLRDVHYPDAGKPYWKNKHGHILDFNISHSNTCIVVALSEKVKVGVDAERIRKLKNLNFKMVMNPDELLSIQEMPDLFFELWSKKEAVVKAADTAGLSRMRDVILTGDQAILDDERWYLKNIKMEENNVCLYEVYLASSEPADKLIIKNVVIDELIYDNCSD